MRRTATDFKDGVALAKVILGYVGDVARGAVMGRGAREDAYAAYSTVSRPPPASNLRRTSPSRTASAPATFAQPARASAAFMNVPASVR